MSQRVQHHQHLRLEKRVACDWWSVRIPVRMLEVRIGQELMIREVALRTLEQQQVGWAFLMPSTSQRMLIGPSALQYMKDVEPLILHYSRLYCWLPLCWTQKRRQMIAERQ